MVQKRLNYCSNAPWKYSKEFCSVYTGSADEVLDKPLAVLFHPDNELEELENAEANGTLMAAAPELLRALTDFYYYFNGATEGKQTLALLIENARKAIDRANGAG